jgi:hypothetical protein
LLAKALGFLLEKACHGTQEVQQQEQTFGVWHNQQCKEIEKAATIWRALVFEQQLVAQQ